MSDERIKIRCPKCLRDGNARIEHMNRRVSCKHCDHIFRAVPFEGEAPASTPSASTPSAPGTAAAERYAARQRIEALEKQLRSIRDELAAQSAEQPAYNRFEAEAEGLRAQLEQARQQARKSEEARQAAEADRDRADRDRAAEAASLRDQLAKALADGRQAAEAHSDRERELLDEITGLRDQLDETVLSLAAPGLEDELRIAREDLAQARHAAEDAARLAHEAARAREAREAEHATALARLRDEHASALARLRDELERARADGRQAEARLAEEAEAARREAEQARAEVEAARAEADEARRSLRDHQADRERADAEHARATEEIRELLDRARADLGDSQETREHRDRLAGEVDALRARLDEAGWLAAGAQSQAEQAEAARASEVQSLRDQLEQAEARARDAEWLGGEARARAEQAEAARASEVRALRDQLDHAEARLREAEATHVDRDEPSGDPGNQTEEFDHARVDRAEAEAERDREAARLAAEAQALREQLAEAEGRLREAEAARAERDEVSGHRDRLAEELERARAQAEQAEAARASEVQSLRDQLEQAEARARDVEAARAERDEARAELDRLRAVVAAEETSADWDSASTEMEVPKYQQPSEPSPGLAEAEARAAAAQAEVEALRAERQKDLAEAEELRGHLAEAVLLINRKDAVLADLALDLALERDKADEAARESGRAEAERQFAAERARVEAEVDQLRRSLGEALHAAEAAERDRVGLAARVAELERATVATPPAPAPASEPDPAAIEAMRKAAAEEAVKGAWADFERRLSETQARLKAANARADLLEAEARDARDQIAEFQRGLELGEITSFEDLASVTSIRIQKDRGATKLTPADAEARLSLARQLAVDRRDKPLIDRIGKMTEKVRADLEAKNFTLAETLIRGAEIEVGLDPGGYSINGLKIFRPSPSIVTSLAALAPGLERVMRQGDRDSIRRTMGEMRTILGDQAGLPEIRRPGRFPAVKRPSTPAEAARLFLGALEAEQWLIRPVSGNRPLPDTSLTTYACLVEAGTLAGPAAREHAPARVELLDKVVQACCAMLVRRQQPDGHFPFLDPRGKPSRFATVVEGMVAQNPAAVKDGWVVAVDPSGAAQVETGQAGLALLRAGAAAGRPEWTQAGLKAAEWAAGQPCLPNFLANAASAGLLARAYLESRQPRHLEALIAKLTLGLLPAQVENGRWIDAATAQTPNHLAILRALHGAWEAVPADWGPIRADLKSAIDRAAGSLLEECKALGVPAQGGALRDLARHRDLTRPDLDPRLEAAILDSATVVQELCHDGAKPKLGVAPDQLAALILA